MITYHLQSHGFCPLDALRALLIKNGIKTDLTRDVVMAGAQCNAERHPLDSVEFGLALGARGLTDVDEIRGFGAWLGRGCEAMFFGLARSGDDFNFTWVCDTYGDKTQSLEVFEHRHATACAILDLAVEAGLVVRVDDLSGYWETRDLSKLGRAAKDQDFEIEQIEAKKGNPFAGVLRRIHGSQNDERPT